MVASTAAVDILALRSLFDECIQAGGCISVYAMHCVASGEVGPHHRLCRKCEGLIA